MSRESVTIGGKGILTLEETAHHVSMSTSWVRRHANGVDFPKPVRQGSRRMWDAVDIQAYRDRLRERAG